VTLKSIVSYKIRGGWTWYDEDP